jgi:hypothetical protein
MDSRCGANSDARVVADKIARVGVGPAAPINEFVDALRRQRPQSSVPYIDPDCGGTGARVLMLFQDPGPMAAQPRGSGMLSISNNDPSAKTLCQVLSEAGIPWSEVVPWNAVPWYTGGANTSDDKLQGLRTLGPLTALLPRLQVVVTFGGTAARSWQQAAAQVPALARYRRVATLHPGVGGLTNGYRQKAPVGRAQLLQDLVRVRSLLG